MTTGAAIREKRPGTRAVILALGAHPDDIELAFGGLLARAKERGLRTAWVDASRGEAGRRGTPGRRREEAQAAAALFGVVRRVAHLPDGAFAGPRFEGRGRGRRGARWVAALLRIHRPRVVLTHAPFDPHPDHRALAAWVIEARRLEGPACGVGTLRERASDPAGLGTAPRDERRSQAARLAGIAPVCIAGAPAREPGTYAAPAPSWVLEMTRDEWSLKSRAIACHRSQLEPRDARDRGEHLPGGLDIRERAERVALHFRSAQGAPGEPLWELDPDGGAVPPRDARRPIPALVELGLA